MAVIQILACDTAEVGDQIGVSLECVGSVDEQVAVGSLQQEGADREGGVEGQHRRLGRVQTADHGIHQSCSRTPRMSWLSPNSCQR